MHTRLVSLLIALWLSSGLAYAQNTGPRSIPAIETAPNDAVTGTTQYLLAKINTAGNLVKAATTDTAVPLYVCKAGCGATAGSFAAYQVMGEVPCIFDNASGASKGGTFVVASVTTAGQCHQQDSPPTNGYAVGTLLDSSTTIGATSRIMAQNIAYIPGSAGAGSGTVNSGTIHSLAYYPATGTVVDDLPSAAPTLNRALIGNGTDWVTSTVTMAGTGACVNQFVRAENANAAPTCATVTSTDVNTSVAITGAGINTSSQPVSAPATWALEGTTSPSTLSGDINDYSACVTTTCRINGGASDRNVTGFAAPATNGTLVDLCNIGTTNNLILKHQSTSSSVANRFDLSGDTTIAPGVCELLRYDTTSTKWRLTTGTVPDYLKIRPMGVAVGDPGTTSPVLAADNDSPAIMPNDYERPVVVKSVACYADAAGLVVNVILTGGTATSVLSANCTCGTAAYAACAVNGAPVLQSFSGTGATCAVTPCSADAQIVSTTGVAKYAVIKMKTLLQ